MEATLIALLPTTVTKRPKLLVKLLSKVAHMVYLKIKIIVNHLYTKCSRQQAVNQDK